MPYPSEHAARVKSPSNYKSFARKTLAPGIDVIFGIKNGKTEIQAYRFDKTKFTVAQAKEWLRTHKINVLLFEPAENREMNARIRS